MKKKNYKMEVNLKERYLRGGGGWLDREWLRPRGDEQAPDGVRCGGTEVAVHLFGGKCGIIIM